MRRMTYRNVVGIVPDPDIIEQPTKIPIDPMCADFLSFAESEATS